ncbi:MAG: methyltransferase domain-containing protein [Robiginitomaculum sp.]
MDNEDQKEFWNGDAGQKWVDKSALLDSMLLPFAQAILDAAKISPDESVLDIGCGAGALSLLATREARAVLGVDISQPLIDLAQGRAQGAGSLAKFKLSDASMVKLEEKCDLVISRFGVMFFAQPALAFSNIRQNVKPGGRMVFACWQGIADNMWARAALEVAMPFFKTAPTPPPPGAPGPFAFADSDALRAMLTKAGWTDVEIKDWSGDIRLPGGNAEESAAFMLEMGPLAGILKAQGLDMAPIEKNFIAYLRERESADGHIDMGSAAWIVSARAP